MCNAFFRLYVVSTCNNDACVFLHNFSHYEKSLTLLPLTNVLIFKGIANFPWNLKHLDGRIWWCNRNQTFVNDRLYALVSVAFAVHGIRIKYVCMYVWCIWQNDTCYRREFCFMILRPWEESLIMLLSSYLRRQLVCVYATYIVMSLDKSFSGLIRKKKEQVTINFQPWMDFDCIQTS